MKTTEQLIKKAQNFATKNATGFASFSDAKKNFLQEELEKINEELAPLQERLLELRKEEDLIKTWKEKKEFFHTNTKKILNRWKQLKRRRERLIAAIHT
jgi:protoheme ferro-lyase